MTLQNGCQQQVTMNVRSLKQYTGLMNYTSYSNDCLTGGQ